MARKFFVGGNFKMNPLPREAKNGLVNALNGASLDPNVGEFIKVSVMTEEGDSNGAVAFVRVRTM